MPLGTKYKIGIGISAVALLAAGATAFYYLRGKSDDNFVLEDAKGQRFVVSYEENKRIGCRKATCMVAKINDTTYTFIDKDARVSLNDDNSKIDSAELEEIVIQSDSGTKKFGSDNKGCATKTFGRCNALYRELLKAIKAKTDEYAEEVHEYHKKP